MSASFCYEIVKPARAKTFTHGTSSDVEALKDTFGPTVSAAQIPVLRAMHRATRLEKTLWSDIADALERLQDGDYESDVSIRVWVEY